METPFGTALIRYQGLRADFIRICELGDDEASRIAGTASDQALGRMVSAPSDTVADLATKLETMLVEYEDSEWDADRVQTIAKDARRLASPEAHWAKLIDRLAVVEATQPSTAELIDEAGALIAEIMAMPSPDAGAARWKLDYVLVVSDSSFSADVLEQLVADYRHFLGETQA